MLPSDRSTSTKTIPATRSPSSHGLRGPQHPDRAARAADDDDPRSRYLLDDGDDVVSERRQRPVGSADARRSVTAEVNATPPGGARTGARPGGPRGAIARPAVDQHHRERRTGVVAVDLVCDVDTVCTARHRPDTVAHMADRRRPGRDGHMSASSPRKSAPRMPASHSQRNRRVARGGWRRTDSQEDGPGPAGDGGPAVRVPRTASARAALGRARLGPNRARAARRGG